jgi:hypothetical protein
MHILDREKVRTVEPAYKDVLRVSGLVGTMGAFVEKQKLQLRNTSSCEICCCRLDQNFYHLNFSKHPCALQR